MKSNRRAFLCAGLLVVVLAGVSGCDRSGSASDADGSAAGDTDVTMLLEELTQAVRKYAVEQRQTPKTLEDLVAKGYLDRVPQSPRGRRFTITPNLEVELASE